MCRKLIRNILKSIKVSFIVCKNAVTFERLNYNNEKIITKNYYKKYYYK